MSTFTNRFIDSTAKPGFQIEYEIRPTTYGRGVFTLQDIPIGSLIWVRGTTNVNIFRTWEEVDSRLKELPDDAARRFFASHVYCDPDIIEITDDGGIWNHSENPNTGAGPIEGHSYAMRDIKAGEELLDDYGMYEYPETYLRLQSLYGENQDFIHRKPAGFSVAYEVKQAEGKGLGLFAKEFIPAGTVVWRCQVGKNMIMMDGETAMRDYLATLSPAERHKKVEHSYCLRHDIVMILLDDGKYMNHSTSPNTYSNETRLDRDISIATRDISPGEEITCDYGEFHFPSWYVRLHAEVSVPLDYFHFEEDTDTSFHAASTNEAIAVHN